MESDNSDSGEDSDSDSVERVRIEDVKPLPGTVGEALANDPIGEMNVNGRLYCKYVPDGEMFVPVLTFCQKRAIGMSNQISYIWTRMDAHSIQKLFSRHATSLLLPFSEAPAIGHLTHRDDVPPSRVVYYSIIGTDDTRQYYGFKDVDKFRKIFRRMLRTIIYETTKVPAPSYLVKIVNGIIVPFDNDDSIIFIRCGLINIVNDICTHKQFDELAPMNT